MCNDGHWLVSLTSTAMVFTLTCVVARILGQQHGLCCRFHSVLRLWSSGYPAWVGFAAWSLLLAALLFLTALVLLAREVCWCDAAHH